jgi:hypothetical protein
VKTSLETSKEIGLGKWEISRKNIEIPKTFYVYKHVLKT